MTKEIAKSSNDGGLVGTIIGATDYLPKIFVTNIFNKERIASFP